eukprot:8260307-Alexandrium_andersonii.AAC.1
MPVIDISTPPRQAATIAAPLLLTPSLDPHARSQQTTVAYLADLAWAANALQERLATLRVEASRR